MLIILVGSDIFIRDRSWRNPLHVTLLAGIRKHLKHLAAIKHAYDVKLLVGVAQLLLQLFVARDGSLFQGLFQFLFVVLVPDVAQPSPLV